MSRTRIVALLAVAACTAAACEKHEFEQPDREAQVLQADSLLTPETFDSIQWASDEERATQGNNAYAATCRSCHGVLGAGDTDYAREQNVNPPSLVREDWPYADVDAVRHRIFTGHAAGMPTWGVAGITPREIDAVAYYVVNVLRPEAMGR
ncbi:MAG TPA: cytochrome c [Longimicrobiales bacterium]|nr:cytochrome c [Longimicrobiales bacterium]